jgi:hypothetical protein
MDFSLREGSPAIATGPNGLDMGALVPAGASISGEPPRFTTLRDATLTIDGPGITHYRYSLDGGAYGPETPIDEPVVLSGLSDGDHRVRVLGKNSASVWQIEPTQSRIWTVNPTYGSLEVGEIMYNPLPTAEWEFIELHNASTTSSVNLSQMVFTNGVAYAFPNDVALEPDGYLLVVTGDSRNDFARFRHHYGLDATVPIYGPYAGLLANDGERVTLETASAAVVLSVEIDDARGWPVAAAGAGHSLVPREEVVQLPNMLEYGGNWRFSTYIGGSPGAADPVLPATVVLNEIMAHTDLNDPRYPGYDSNDWIEIYNRTDRPVNLRDWYLSDDEGNLTKWAIFTTATIPAHGRLTFDEITGFHHPLTEGFGINKSGERIFLSYLPGTDEDRVVDAVRFKGQEAGVSLGRYPDGEPAWYEWYAMAPSPDAPNTPPNDELIVSEFMYHPADGTTVHEYIELQNPTDQSVNLWNAEGPWRIDGTDLLFTPNTSIPPGGSALVVNFNPADSVALESFKTYYGLSEITVPMFGPFVGNLSNRVERFALERAQAPDNATDPVSWVIVDEAIYFDRWPWPREADGAGPSLHRVAAERSGNDPSNWVAGPPSPGVASAVAHALTANAVNGTLQIVPDTTYYTPGAEVLLTAIPATGYHFVGWSGDLPAGHEMDNPLVLTMDGDKSLTAACAINTYALVVAAQNGVVEELPDEAEYDHGTPVTLTPIPAVGYRFAGWEGDVPAGHEMDSPLTLVMDGDKTLTATFTVDNTVTRASRIWTQYE